MINIQKMLRKRAGRRKSSKAYQVSFSGVLGWMGSNISEINENTTYIASAGSVILYMTVYKK